MTAAMWQSTASGWAEHADYVDGLAAAEVAGEVVVSDVAPAMVAIAAERARVRSLDNVHALTLDLERIEQPDASYDVVLCREGRMFASGPARATREIRR